MKDSNQPHNKDWRDSRPHLLLLSKFLRGDSSVRYVNADYWESVLNEGAEIAIQHFLKEGMLEPAGLRELLDFKYKATELKSMLKERGLKISGRKSEIIERLISGDKDGMLDATKDVDLCRCTAAGKELADAYLNEEKAKRTNAERDVRNLLDKRDFPGAIRIVASYEATQVFSRGVGIDWKNYTGDRDVEALKVIFGKTPRILTGIKDDVLQRVRVGAAMMQLWGTNTTKSWLPDHTETGIYFDADTAARMLVFHASHLRTIEQCKRAGIKMIEILGTDDGNACSSCAQISGKKYKAEEVPEIPHPECTSEIGCRCTAVTGDFGG